MSFLINPIKMQFGLMTELLSPRVMFRKRIIMPIELVISQWLSLYKKKTNDGYNNMKELIIKTSIIALFVSFILWISIFLYVAFYYTYMPNIAHMRPVHLQFKSCDELPGVCSFPSAHVQLTKMNQILMVGQPYRIRLMLDMPESPVNKDLGMFMVCAQLRARGGSLVSSSCRSAMLRHRSGVHQLLRTLFLSPLLISGFGEEKQVLQVELFSDFEDDQGVPITDAYVELQSRHAQLYGASLQIEAHFTGLRYLMFHWPVLSSVIGVSTNLVFVMLVFVLSWYHVQEGLPYLSAIPGFGIVKEEGMGKVKLEREDSSFLDDSRFDSQDDYELKSDMEL